MAVLHHVTFDVADLSTLYVGSSTACHVTLDLDAAGNGWFVDPTPGEDTEFGHAAGAMHLVTDPAEAPAGHMDLLTTVMHEMGHQIGLDDLYSAQDSGDLMYGYLVTGERRLPGEGTSRRRPRMGCRRMPWRPTAPWRASTVRLPHNRRHC